MLLVEWYWLGEDILGRLILDNNLVELELSENVDTVDRLILDNNSVLQLVVERLVMVVDILDLWNLDNMMVSPW